MIFGMFRAPFGPKMAQVNAKFPEFCQSWTKLAASWPNLEQIGRKLAQVGGLGPFKFEKVLPAQAGSIKKKERPTTTKPQGATGEPPGSHRVPHFRDQLPPVPLKEDLKD